VAGAFSAVVLVLIGLDLFAVGVMFNYMVSLFHKRPIRQGLFGRPVFKVPLERQFGWLGALALLAGGVLGLVSLILGIGGWPIVRLWLYFLAGTMLTVVGLQLIVFWVIVLVLEELNEREAMIQADMECEL
jgi:hypothetical protein